MKIIEINKTVYRYRLNKVILGFIITLAVLSLGFGTLLIALFSQTGMPNNSGTEQPNNFKYNLMGVVLALMACAAILHTLKSKPFFKEIYYVWQLKQIQNLIYRKLNKIKIAAFDKDDIDAMVILDYYYTSLNQVYVLDDNTLTLSTLKNDHQKLLSRVINKNIDIKSKQFNKTMLSCY